MLAIAAQFGLGDHPTPTSFFEPVLTIVVSAVGGCLLIGILQRIVPPSKRAIRARLSRTRRLRAAAGAELRARAMMDELCPNGWRAQIVMFSSAEELPPEAPDPEQTRVLLDWAAVGESSVVRRVWAPDVKHALDAMVADRVTDETLQQIEQRALSDGAVWPDL